MSLEESMGRHPAGKAQKQTIWDTTWAINKAMELGREQERERIIKLLEDVFVVGSAQAAVALIKGENNG